LLFEKWTQSLTNTRFIERLAKPKTATLSQNRQQTVEELNRTFSSQKCI